MGREKDALIEREENWKRKARAEGMQCALCSTTPEYDEREIFLATGRCARCERMVKGD